MLKGSCNLLHRAIQPSQDPAWLDTFQYQTRWFFELDLCNGHTEISAQKTDLPASTALTELQGDVLCKEASKGQEMLLE